MKSKITALFTAGLVALAVLVGGAAYADTASTTGNGQRISPVRSDFTINPGSQQSYLLSVQNVTSASQTLEAVVNDFVAGNNENGQPQLILKPTSTEPTTGLRKFVQPIANVTLVAGETKQVRVTVAIPTGTAGGGYFGAVRFVPAGSGANKSVNLTASVGSLILVKVPGNITESLGLTSFDVRTDPQAASGGSFYTSGKGLYAVARFQNKGNVQEEPFGKVVLLKGKKILQTTEINNTDPKGNVLPSSIRRFSVKLNKVGSWGKFTVQGNFGYGTNGQLISGTSTFYVIPIVLIILIIAVIVLIVAAIIWLPKAIKAYNRRVLRNARRR
jgi:hypothetical protein